MLPAREMGMPLYKRFRGLVGCCLNVMSHHTKQGGGEPILCEFMKTHFIFFWFLVNRKAFRPTDCKDFIDDRLIIFEILMCSWVATGKLMLHKHRYQYSHRSKQGSKITSDFGREPGNHAQIPAQMLLYVQGLWYFLTPICYSSKLPTPQVLRGEP